MQNYYILSACVIVAEMWQCYYCSPDLKRAAGEIDTNCLCNAGISCEVHFFHLQNVFHFSKVFGCSIGIQLAWVHHGNLPSLRNL
jgi:hypothetical protein